MPEEIQEPIEQPVIEKPAAGIYNLSREGEEPEHGDSIRIVDQRGQSVTKVFYVAAPAAEPAPRFSGTNFLEALGDSTLVEIASSPDKAVSVVIQKHFDAVINSGKTLHTDHPKFQQAMAYLVASETVPSMTAEKKAEIDGGQ